MLLQAQELLMTAGVSTIKLDTTGINTGDSIAEQT